MTFAVGAAVSFPGVSYLHALHHIVELNPGLVPAVLLIVFFCVMQQLLLEPSLLGYLLSPEGTAAAVARTRASFHLRGHVLIEVVLTTIGVLLVVRGLVTIS